MAILRVRDENGNVIEIPAIVGPQGERGEKGDDGADGTTITVGGEVVDTFDADTKLDKVTETGKGDRLYRVNTKGEQLMVNMAISSLANSVAWRNDNGCLNVATPTEDSNAATKKYVDDLFNSLTNAEEASF
ncbi:MAG: hypothetical protein IJX39_04730 [Clostridia bacterium]|nr:hypothetical protein [Clostridia bacterium]